MFYFEVVTKLVIQTEETLRLSNREKLLMLLTVHCAPDVASARLVAQKSKGMPLISISLTRLKGSVASKAMENLSLQLFKDFKSMQQLLINGNILYIYFNYYTSNFFPGKGMLGHILENFIVVNLHGLFYKSYKFL